VEYHGGQIWVDGEARESGAVVRWTLPMLGSSPAADRGAPELAGAGAGAGADLGPAGVPS
jgi:hypothetical protein